MTLLDETMKKIGPMDNAAMSRAHARLSQLTMPHWAMGRLMDLAEELAGITASEKPATRRKTMIVMAADHGIARQSVSLYPQEVTREMVYNFVNGGAGINAISRLVGAEVHVVDMGVNGDLSPLSDLGKIRRVHIADGTADMSSGPAMTREQAIAAIEAGIQTVTDLAGATDIFGTGEMGIGNTTPSSAIVSVITKTPVETVTGCGTGIDEAQRQKKANVIQLAIEKNAPDPEDGVDILSKIGGFEIGGIAGVILGAAALRKPVLVDGFISTAGALIAHTLCPQSAAYMIAAHKSVEPGHRAALEQLGKEPLLDLDMRLGEGTGAALAMNIVDAAVRVLTEVATFEEAGVSEAD